MVLIDERDLPHVLPMLTMTRHQLICPTKMAANNHEVGGQPRSAVGASAQDKHSCLFVPGRRSPLPLAVSTLSGPFRRFAAPRASRYWSCSSSSASIKLLLVLLAPAFTYIKGGTQRHQRLVHNQRRARQRAHLRQGEQYLHMQSALRFDWSNDYGQVQIAIVASRDRHKSVEHQPMFLRLPALLQVGKMITLNNVHIGDTGIPAK